MGNFVIQLGHTSLRNLTRKVKNHHKRFCSIPYASRRTITILCKNGVKLQSLGIVSSEDSLGMGFSGNQSDHSRREPGAIYLFKSNNDTWQ